MPQRMRAPDMSLPSGRIWIARFEGNWPTMTPMLKAVVCAGQSIDAPDAAKLTAQA
jgi:hypothetical protein